MNGGGGAWRPAEDSRATLRPKHVKSETKRLLTVATHVSLLLRPSWDALSWCGRCSMGDMAHHDDHDDAPI